jgi:DUF4097 and DUF4098 domain-containing protein YvlB
MPTFETPGPVLLDLRLPSGMIEIVTSDRSDTEVELQPLRDDEATREAMAAARIQTHEAPDRRVVLVEVPSRRGFFGRQPQFRLRVSAPEGADVSCRTRSADVSCAGVFGGLDVKTASGDIVFDVVSGEAVVNTASGDVRGGVVRGRVGVTTASGDIVVERAEAAAHLNAVSGDVYVREALAEIDLHTVSGDQKVEAAAGGPIGSQSVSGDVWIGIARGRRVYINANSLSGETTSALTMTDAPAEGASSEIVEVRANTVSGDIHLARAVAPDPVARA